MSKKWIYAAIVHPAPGVRVRRLSALPALVGSALVGLALVGLALLGSAGLAAAHNELIGSDPPDGARLASGPARVALTFDLPLQSGFSTVTVTGPDRNQWQAGPATEDGATVSAPVRPLGPTGQYTIAYQVLSADGHPVRGAVRFTLTQPGTGIPAAQQEGSSPPTVDGVGTAANRDAATHTESGSTPVWPWLVGAGVLAAAAVALRVGRSG